MFAVSNHLGRVTDRCRHHFEADHHDAQVQTRVIAFEQYPAVEALSLLDGLVDLLQSAQVDCDTLALFAIHRLDHHRAVLFEKSQVVIGITGQLLNRHAQTGGVQNVLGETFVWHKVMLTALVRSLRIRGNGHGARPGSG